MDYFNDTWNILDKYFQIPYFLTKHHLDSYNDFVNNKLENTIKVLNPFVTIKNDNKISVFIGGLEGNEITKVKQTYKDEKIFPNNARLYNLNYSFDIFANILIRYENTTTGNITDVRFDRYKIGAIPIMLHSSDCVLFNKNKEELRELGECIYDQGGYFIIDGKEKVIVAQERIVTNKIFINKSKDPSYSYTALLRCISEDNPLFPKTLNLYVNHFDKKKNPNSILITSPGIRNLKIPICVLFKAFGIETDKQIIELINPDNDGAIIDFFRSSIVHCGSLNVTDQRSAIDYLTNFVDYGDIKKTMFVLMDDLFPNMGDNLRNKALFLGNILNKLIKVVLGVSEESDRDSYIYKRVDNSGFLISGLFVRYYNEFRNMVRRNIDRKYNYEHSKFEEDITKLVNYNNLNFIFQSSIIEDGFKKSLKGNFGVSMVEENDNDSKKEIVQDLNRISYLSFMSHLRRVNTPLDATAKIVGPHRLHPSQWGIMCPCESPDGASIGLLKNFAIMTVITFDNSTTHIITCLKDNNLIPIDKSDMNIIQNYTKIFVNGNYVGFHKNPDELFKILKLLKRNSYINIYTSISWDIFNNEMTILTEAGRCCRPLYVIYNEKLLIEDYIHNKEITWNQLISKNNDILLDHYINPFKTYKKTIEDLEKTQCPIEYIDVEESNCSYIAMNKYEITKYNNYCEIHPSTIFGILTHNIPLSNYNQAPRNIFSGAQGKQAIGCYATNFNDRIDTMAYVMDYPQKCLLNTRYCEYLNLNNLPNGQNLVLAFMTYTGYNMEDAIIINKTSIQRGLFNITYFKNIVEIEENTKNNEEKIVFNNPNTIINNGYNLEQIKWANYNKLDENGMPKLNTTINENDAIIGKTKITTILKEDNLNIFGNEIKQEIYSDRSLIADKTVSGKVDKVFVYKNNDNMNVCKLRLRKTRIPELGDKSCSRHAQKGVIGGIIPIENMPYTKDGIVPDMIINPHAIPSRMTCAHLLEMVLGKYASMKGTCVDGTPFNNNDYESLYESLEKDHGFDKHGNEILYNGQSGEQIDCSIFIGPIFYERLKHMVADKINYRQLDLKTIKNTNHEPEILKEAPVNVVTHQPTKGRGQNGGLRIGEMERDSLISHGAASFIKESMMERSDIYRWKTLNSDGELVNIETPYAFKQFVHEVNAMNINIKLDTSIDKYSDKKILQDDYIDDDFDKTKILNGDDESEEEDDVDMNERENYYENDNDYFNGKDNENEEGE
jgi:DNA-directed RNA polymerase II subunit RPB2